MSWTRERETKLRQLWAEGLSMSEIASRLGVTRGSICGKVHNLGLQPRTKAKPSVARRQPSLPGERRVLDTGRDVA
jgi:hypothetical protein